VSKEGVKSAATSTTTTWRKSETAATATATAKWIIAKGAHRIKSGAWDNAARREAACRGINEPTTENIVSIFSSDNKIITNIPWTRARREKSNAATKATTTTKGKSASRRGAKIGESIIVATIHARWAADRNVRVVVVEDIVVEGPVPMEQLILRLLFASSLLFNIVAQQCPPVGAHSDVQFERNVDMVQTLPQALVGANLLEGPVYTGHPA